MEDILFSGKHGSSQTQNELNQTRFVFSAYLDTTHFRGSILPKVGQTLKILHCEGCFLLVLGQNCYFVLLSWKEGEARMS